MSNSYDALKINREEPFTVSFATNIFNVIANCQNNWFDVYNNLYKKTDEW